MHMCKTIAAAALAIWVGGCATQPHLIPGPERLPPVSITQIKSVAVISTCGDDLTLTHLGSFSGGEKFFNIKEWQLDSQIRSEVVSALHNKYEVKQVTYDPNYFKPKLGQLFPALAVLTGGFDVATAVRDHAKIAGGHPVDAYIVLYAAGRKDNILGTPALLEGIGLYQFSFLTRLNSAAFVSCDLAIVDGHSFKRLGESLVEVPNDPSGSIFSGGYGVPIDNGLWAESVAAMTTEQQQKVRQILTSLLHAEIEPTVRVLRLVQ